MPLIQITLPENALDESQQAQLAEQTTDILLSLEGMAANPKARRLTWTYLQTHSRHHLDFRLPNKSGQSGRKILLRRHRRPVLQFRLGTKTTCLKQMCFLNNR